LSTWKQTDIGVTAHNIYFHAFLCMAVDIPAIVRIAYGKHIYLTIGMTTQASYYLAAKQFFYFIIIKFTQHKKNFKALKVYCKYIRQKEGTQ